MTKSWQELRTVDDFIESCKEDAGKYSADLSKKEKENLASAILSLTFSDHFNEWGGEHPILITLETLASNLAWSNAFNVDEDWQKLIACIEGLERQVHKSWLMPGHALPGDIHTIQDFILYCREVLAERPEYMREKEQERPATAMVAAGCVDSFEELEKQYPQLTEIYELALDLEISNTANTTTDWRRIKQLVEELDTATKRQS